MAVEYIWVQGENGATMMARQPQADPKGLFGEEGITFKDVLDIINPLQQLPIIGSIYRELTGDTIKPGARLIGGGIYGLGIVGVVGAALNNAVEYDTGHDIAGTALALARGESLKDMQMAQAAKRGGTTQLASAQYYSGGADPIDPTSLPAGAKFVDVPAGPAAAPSTQYAALPTDPAAGSTPAAAVSVSPLPANAAPTVNPTINLAPAAASEAATIPALPTQPAGLTGLSAGSRLPTAGSITPVASALAAAATTENLQAGAASPVATVSAATAAAASPAQGASTLAAAKSSDGFFPVPPRVNNVTPRMPIAITPANVGTQPLALSNTERRTVPPVTVSAPSATTDPAMTASQMVPAAQVPDAMMRALDKYDALMRSRRNGNQLDRNL
jgi:hypothetical protein